MSAATRALKIAQKDGPNWIGPVGVKADAIIYHGTMVGLSTSGIQAVPASTSIAPKGVADLQTWHDQSRTGQATIFNETTSMSIDNTGGDDGDRQLILRQGSFIFNNKVGDEVTIALVGQAVYVTDDNTVQATSGGAQAGILVGMDPLTGKPIVNVGISASVGLA